MNALLLRSHSNGFGGDYGSGEVKVTYVIQIWIGRLGVISVVDFLSYLIGNIRRRRDSFWGGGRTGSTCPPLSAPFLSV